MDHVSHECQIALLKCMLACPSIYCFNTWFCEKFQLHTSPLLPLLNLTLPRPLTPRFWDNVGQGVDNVGQGVVQAVHIAFFLSIEPPWRWQQGECWLLVHRNTARGTSYLMADNVVLAVCSSCWGSSLSAILLLKIVPYNFVLKLNMCWPTCCAYLVAVW